MSLMPRSSDNNRETSLLQLYWLSPMGHQNRRWCLKICIFEIVIVTNTILLLKKSATRQLLRTMVLLVIDYWSRFSTGLSTLHTRIRFRQLNFARHFVTMCTQGLWKTTSNTKNNKNIPKCNLVPRTFSLFFKFGEAGKRPWHWPVTWCS